MLVIKMIMVMILGIRKVMIIMLIITILMIITMLIILIMLTIKIMIRSMLIIMITKKKKKKCVSCTKPELQMSRSGFMQREMRWNFCQGMIHIFRVFFLGNAVLYIAPRIALSTAM